MHFFIWLGTHAPWWWGKLRVFGTLFVLGGLGAIIALGVVGCLDNTTDPELTDSIASSSPGGQFIRSNPCTLTASGPITVTANGQVIEYKDITATGSTNGILCHGYDNVTIRFCQITHDAGHGIDAAQADSLTIDNCKIVCSDLTSPHSTVRNNLQLYQCNDLYVHRTELNGGSAGAYVHQCPSAHFKVIEARNARGPSPRGQFIQFDNSDNGMVQNLYGKNNITASPISYCEDNVSFYQSDACTLKDSNIFGNDACSGFGVMFEGCSGGLCTMVETNEMANGSFSTSASSCIKFLNTKDYGHLCGDQVSNRGCPLSGGRIWVAQSGGSGCIVTSKYWPAMASGTLCGTDCTTTSSYTGCAGPEDHTGSSWDCPSGSCLDYSLTQYTPGLMQNLIFCWEPGGPAQQSEGQAP